MPSLNREKVTVLYVAGYLRSGSTLLDRILGQIDGFVSVGELRYVWEESLAENQPCGCGALFKDCSFWDAVFQEAYGSFDQIDLDRVIQLSRSVDRMRYIPELLSSKKTSNYVKNLAEYSENLHRLYLAIRKVSGSRIIVDSSKVPSYAYTLANIPDIDLSVVHLVRDSRAVAYSWLRRKVKHEIQGEKVYMDRYKPSDSAVGWMLTNSLVEALKYNSVEHMTVRYEDLVSDTQAILSNILTLVRENDQGLPITDDHTVELKTNHTVAGNPIRFKRGKTELIPDEEWKSRMTKADEYLVTLLTWPLLLKYGYLSTNKI